MDEPKETLHDFRDKKRFGASKKDIETPFSQFRNVYLQRREVRLQSSSFSAVLALLVEV